MSTTQGRYAIINGVTDQVVALKDGLRDARERRDALNRAGWRRKAQRRVYQTRQLTRRFNETQVSYWWQYYNMPDQRVAARRITNRRQSERRYTGPMDARYPRRSYYLSRPAGNRV